MLGVSQRAAAVGGTERAAGLETILANRGVTTKNDASPSTSPPDPWAKELPFFFLAPKSLTGTVLSCLPLDLVPALPSIDPPASSIQPCLTSLILFLCPLSIPQTPFLLFSSSFFSHFCLLFSPVPLSLEELSTACLGLVLLLPGHGHAGAPPVLPAALSRCLPETWLSCIHSKDRVIPFSLQTQQVFLQSQSTHSDCFHCQLLSPAPLPHGIATLEVAVVGMAGRYSPCPGEPELPVPSSSLLLLPLLTRELLPSAAAGGQPALCFLLRRWEKTNKQMNKQNPEDAAKQGKPWPSSGGLC